MKSRNIRLKISNAGYNRIWRISDFPEYPARTVSKTLARLSAKGFIDKIRNGIYYYGKNTVLGKAVPSAGAVADMLIRKKFQGGLDAFYNLGLTTQIAANMSIVSPSQAKIRNAKIIRRNITHLNGATQQEFWIIEALRKIKVIPDCSPADAALKIKAYIKRHRISFERLCHFSMDEPPRVRALLGAIGQELRSDKSCIHKLKKTMNPFTIFKLGIKGVLKFGKEWNIE